MSEEQLKYLLKKNISFLRDAQNTSFLFVSRATNEEVFKFLVKELRSVEILPQEKHALLFTVEDLIYLISIKEDKTIYITPNQVKIDATLISPYRTIETPTTKIIIKPNVIVSYEYENPDPESSKIEREGYGVTLIKPFIKDEQLHVIYFVDFFYYYDSYHKLSEKTEMTVLTASWHVLY